MRAPVQDDYILRLIEQAMRALGESIRQALGLKRAGQYAAALGAIAVGISTLLGPLGDLADRLDSATAAQLVGNPVRIAAWAQLVAEEADIYRRMGRSEAGARRERRALELGLEAWLRDHASPVGELIRDLASRCESQALEDRYLTALADFLRQAQPVIT